MRETVRRRNEQLKRRIEEEREVRIPNLVSKLPLIFQSYFLSGHRVKRDVYSDEEKMKRDQVIISIVFFQ